MHVQAVRLNARSEIRNSAAKISIYKNNSNHCLPLFLDSLAFQELRSQLQCRDILVKRCKLQSLSGIPGHFVRLLQLFPHRRVSQKATEVKKVSQLNTERELLCPVHTETAPRGAAAYKNSSGFAQIR